MASSKRGAAPRVTARAGAQAKARAAARPLPRNLIEVYYWSEAAFRTKVRELEEDPRFQKLVTRGLLEKVQLRGRIPRHKYEDFKDHELTAFFEKYDIARHPGWEDDFFDPRAMARRHALGRKYGCPVGELSRILRYCQYLYDLSDGGPGRVVDTNAESPDFLQFTPSAELFDLSPIIQKIEIFTSRHGLDRDRFASLFFTGERDADAVAEELGCSVREVEVVRGLVERVQTINALQMDVGPSRVTETRSSMHKGASKTEPVAEIYMDRRGDPQLRILADDLYDVKYRFHDRDLEDLPREEQDLLGELRAVNQRKTVLVRLLTYIYKYQYRFFATGRRTDLLPLTQAKVARDLQEEEATVSRLIRDKTVRTPWGTYPLKWAFVKVGTMVEILLTEREQADLDAGKRERPFTDKDLQEVLRREYGVTLSRRSITYHRNRFRRDSNFYARRRSAPNPA